MSRTGPFAPTRLTRADDGGASTGQGGRRLFWRRAAVWTLAGVVLLAVFAAYLAPAMAMQLAQQLWSCF